MENLSRRMFLGELAGVSALALGGCSSVSFSDPKGGIAVQLYSIRNYIKAVGIERALADVAAIGYKGVEFAGYYGKDAKTLRKILSDNGLVACGTHVGRDSFGPEKIKATAEFNVELGNTLLICPGGGNFPPKPKQDEEAVALDDWMKMLVDYYNRAAEDAAKFGCKVGLHNHTGEFKRKLADGTTYWDYFFSNTSSAVCMEQDVGWTTCAGVDPCEQYRKYPHRSPTLHAKENGNGKTFDGILGRPSPSGVKGVDWERLAVAADGDGVAWWVVECERHFDSLDAIRPSFEFLKSMGRNGAAVL